MYNQTVSHQITHQTAGYRLVEYFQLSNSHPVECASRLGRCQSTSSIRRSQPAVHGTSKPPSFKDDPTAFNIVCRLEDKLSCRTAASRSLVFGAGAGRVET